VLLFVAAASIGSVMVASSSTVLASTGLNRSTRCSAWLKTSPTSLPHVLPLKFVVSTTSAYPSATSGEEEAEEADEESELEALLPQGGECFERPLDESPAQLFVRHDLANQQLHTTRRLRSETSTENMAPLLTGTGR
jgi:hypothetical protein